MNTSTLSRSSRISQEGDIAPSEELWCTAVKNRAKERRDVLPGGGDAIRDRDKVSASKRKLRIAAQR